MCNIKIMQFRSENGNTSIGEKTGSTATAIAEGGAALPPLANVWEDNWDDETVETEFHKQLEEELKKRGLKLD
jgi:hypothetical protein